MSAWLCDSAELISGAWLSSAYAGHGILGVNVPSTGIDGPPYLYPALNLPADNGVEVRGLITRWPTNGVLTPGEDGVFTYDGASDYFEFLIYADAIPSAVDIGFGPGISRITLNVGGDGGGSFSGAVALDGATVSGSFSGGSVSNFTGSVQLGNVGATGSFTGAVVTGTRAARSSRRALRMDGAGRRPRQTQ